VSKATLIFTPQSLGAVAWQMSNDLALRFRLDNIEKDPKAAAFA